MPILSLDTSAAQLVAVLIDPVTGAVREGVSTERAQRSLLLIDELMQDASAGDIARVVVGTGPGGFTGLRIGVTTARGIAATLGVPLHGVDSQLASVYEDAASAAGEPVWALVDARRGETFARPFRLVAAGVVEPCGPLQVLANASVDEAVCGQRRSSASAPTPASLARASLQVVRLEEAAGPGPRDITPSYGRAPDAEPRRIGVRIDELARPDIDRLLVLEQRCFSEPWTRGMYEEELARDPSGAVLLAARADHALVGAALAARIGDSWHVLNVLVDPSARRQGIAQQLMEGVLEQTAASGAGAGWTLEVRTSNSGAIALYEGFGFVSHGTRPGYYADTGEDALVMWKATS